MGEERKVLTAGDTAFIPFGTVHATFVAPDAAETARLWVVLGPSHGIGGYETVDVIDRRTVGLAAPLITTAINGTPPSTSTQRPARR